jgi:hypothetical protein
MIKSIVVAVAFVLMSLARVEAADIKELFAELIRQYGFQCPSIQNVTSYGNDAYGKVVKIWCGQGDYRGNPIYFRVTEVGTLPNVNYRIEPWHD